MPRRPGSKNKPPEPPKGVRPITDFIPKMKQVQIFHDVKVHATSGVVGVPGGNEIRREMIDVDQREVTTTQIIDLVDKGGRPIGVAAKKRVVLTCLDKHRSQPDLRYLNTRIFFPQKWTCLSYMGER